MKTLIKKHSKTTCTTFFVFFLFSWLFYSNAYVCDDAYITFRSLDNFVRGMGLRWNIDERVQVFTSPLFTLILAFPYWLIHNRNSIPEPERIYILVLLISFILTSLTFFWLIKNQPKRLWFFFSFLLLCSSQAFITFTSSGLETPLIYLLVSIFFILFLFKNPPKLKHEFSRLYFFLGLALLTRMDLIILFIMPCFYLVILGWKHSQWKSLGPMLPGILPIAFWMCFSTIYFGFPFPNSYYAKLGQCSDRSILIGMGINYLTELWRQDPITILGIFMGCIAGIITARREPRCYFAVLAVVGYVFYIIWIGGDFIGFRFLTPPLLISSLLIYLFGVSRKGTLFSRIGVLGIISLIFYSVVTPHTPIRTYRDGPIANDVAYYFDASSLSKWKPGKGFPFGKYLYVVNAQSCLELRKLEARVAVWGDGLNGFCRGHTTFLIDPHGITDPLVARLIQPVKEPFRPGHLEKPLPLGYIEHIIDKRMQIHDPNVADFYKKLHGVVSGKLFSAERWRYIWLLNIGSNRRYTNAYTELSQITAEMRTGYRKH